VYYLNLSFLLLLNKEITWQNIIKFAGLYLSSNWLAILSGWHALQGRYISK